MTVKRNSESLLLCLRIFFNILRVRVYNNFFSSIRFSHATVHNCRLTSNYIGDKLVMEKIDRQLLSFSKKMNLCTVHIVWHLSLLILPIFQDLQLALKITVVSARNLWSMSPAVPTIDTFKITFALSTTIN